MKNLTHPLRSIYPFALSVLALQDDTPSKADLAKAAEKAVRDLINIEELRTTKNFEETEEELIAELTTILEKNNATQVSNTISISAEELPEWLPDRKKKMNPEQWRWWNRYDEYLRANTSLSDIFLQRMTESTDEILGYCGDPFSKEPWDRRGLVFGQVQAGKTSNYVGLINKAIDTGYSVIIVLTGLTENLRDQGQKRIDEGVTGWTAEWLQDLREIKRTTVGVGKQNPHAFPSDRMTTRISDFVSRSAKQLNLPQPEKRRPAVFVIKKNKYIMDNLYDYMEQSWAEDVEGGHGVKSIPGCPLLLIDDEADHGSIDTGKDAVASVTEGRLEPNIDHDPTAINKAIRRFLKLFQKSSYVAYTATPEATLQIPHTNHTDEDGDDLFPRDFIVDIPTPSNHFGPERLFGSVANQDNRLPLLTDIPEQDLSWIPPKHKKDHVPTWEDEQHIPGSLRDALRSFVVSSIIRRIRKLSGNTSMLVHVTHFTNVQDQVRKQLEWFRSQMLINLRNNPDEEIGKYEKIWKTYQETTKDIRENWGRQGSLFRNDSHSWDEVDRYDLVEIIEGIEFKTINGTSSDNIPEDPTNKSQPKMFVVVGGQKLARGLTLPGLTISYFQRTTTMYDTLMQMGRWFGYREGYVDLCRLYASEQMHTNFWAIGAATEDLRSQFRDMKYANKTPKDYGLHIQCHKGLQITSAMKMRHSHEKNIGYSNAILRTMRYYRSKDAISKNLDNLAKLITKCGKPNSKVEKHQVWVNKTPNDVIDFLQSYNQPVGVFQRGDSTNKNYSDADLAWQYIGKELKKDKPGLTDWTIVLINPKRSETQSKTRLFNWRKKGYPAVPLTETTLSLRSGSLPEKNWDDEHFNASSLDSGEQMVKTHYELNLLTPQQKEAALASTLAEWERKLMKDKKPEKPSYAKQRAQRDSKRGVLWIWLIQNPEGENLKPLVGYLLDFPYSSGPPSHISVIVNPVQYEHEYEQLQWDFN